MFNEIGGCSQEKLDVLLGYLEQIQYQLLHTVRGVKTITTLEGYKDLLIYPPSALLEGEDEDDDETDSE